MLVYYGASSCFLPRVGPKLEDNLKIFEIGKWKTTLVRLKIEDYKTNYLNGRHPQLFFVEDNLNLFLKEKRHEIQGRQPQFLLGKNG